MACRNASSLTSRIYFIMQGSEIFSCTSINRTHLYRNTKGVWISSSVGERSYSGLQHCWAQKERRDVRLLWSHCKRKQLHLFISFLESNQLNYYGFNLHFNLGFKRQLGHSVSNQLNVKNFPSFNLGFCWGFFPWRKIDMYRDKS